MHDEILLPSIHPQQSKTTAVAVDFKRDGDIGDAFVSRQRMLREGHGRSNHLTYIELGITNACNLKCTYCGEFENPIYRTNAANRSKVDAVIHALDQLETLRLLSITGGEPLLSPYYVDNIVLPVLDFANSKGIITQINSNLVVPRSALDKIRGKVSIIHTSFNYTGPQDFHRIALGGQGAADKAAAMFDQLVGNIRHLVAHHVCVTAESILYRDTFTHLVAVNHLLASMGVARQEIQPPFPTKNDVFKTPSLDDLLEYMDDFLNNRDPQLLVQLDCAPFFWCNANDSVRQLLERMDAEPNFVTRSCPDGRSRLNLNLDGEVRITDFSEIKPIGLIRENSLKGLFDQWQESDLYKDYNCECAERRCLGPCILIANTYYPGWLPGRVGLPAN